MPLAGDVEEGDGEEGEERFVTGLRMEEKSVARDWRCMWCGAGKGGLQAELMFDGAEGAWQ